MKGYFGMNWFLSGCFGGTNDFSETISILSQISLEMYRSKLVKSKKLKQKQQQLTVGGFKQRQKEASIIFITVVQYDPQT